jgi:hypothetical protein
MAKLTVIPAVALIIAFASIPVGAQETTSYMITWDPSPEPDVVAYVIYRSLDLSPGTEIDSVDVGTHSYIDTGLDPDVRYYYRVIAKNEAGERSAHSNPVSGTTISQNAEPGMHDLCRVENIIDIGGGTYEIEWNTAGSTIGFAQYGSSYASLDSISAWDETYATAHISSIGDLVMPSTYYVRAVSYDNNKNMIISAIDTITASGEEPNPPLAPQLNIYPVPYHPANGMMLVNNIPQGGSVAVYNDNGVEVWQEYARTGTAVTWDGKNSQGSPVMSGVYYVLVRDSSGNVTAKKPIMLVR